MDLLTFLPESVLIVVVCTYVMGIFLKRINSFPDKYITIMLMVFAIVFTIALSMFDAKDRMIMEIVINGILQGIICWGVSVGINQTAKQLKKPE